MLNASDKPQAAEISELQQFSTSSAKDIDSTAMKAEGVADQQAEQAAREDEGKDASRIRASLQRPARLKNLKQYLVGYWGLKDSKEVERVQFVEACNLPPQHQGRYDFLNDDRLAGTMIAIVPDDMWIKGNQPSESDAKQDLILFKESDYNGTDNIGWMTHELSHCLRYKDTKDKYSDDSQTYAFDDIKSEYPYPNNKVEAYTFSQQFRYLRGKGVARDDIKKMLSEHYDEEDFQFFDRLLDEIFES